MGYEQNVDQVGHEHSNTGANPDSSLQLISDILHMVQEKNSLQEENLYLKEFTEELKNVNSELKYRIIVLKDRIISFTLY